MNTAKILLISSIFVGGALFSMITKKEIFPFAPYTMYSNNYSNDYFEKIEIHVGFDANKEIDYKDVYEKYFFPIWDEARLKNFIKEKIEEAKLEDIERAIRMIGGKILKRKKIHHIRVQKKIWFQLSLDKFYQPDKVEEVGCFLF